MNAQYFECLSLCTVYAYMQSAPDYCALQFVHVAREAKGSVFLIIPLGEAAGAWHATWSKTPLRPVPKHRTIVCKCTSC